MALRVPSRDKGLQLGRAVSKPIATIFSTQSQVFDRLPMPMAVGLIGTKMPTRSGVGSQNVGGL